MFQQISITIYGSTIRVQSKDASTLNVLGTEFQQFLSSDSTAHDFLLTLSSTAAPTGLLPTLTAQRISQNSLSYDEGPRRWNDYFGKALSCYDYDTAEGILYSSDPHLLHEIAYLMILSLTGKDLDSRGYHKIHACAFRYKGQDAVVMLPSKGGKTTLFIELAKIPGVTLLSDDTPLVDQHGLVHPFPLRLGVEELPEHLKANQDSFVRFHRQYFNDKWLIPLDQLGAAVAQGAGARPRLFIGYRRNDPRPFIVRAGWWTMYRALLEHMIIGIGLPMVLEYFVRHTWRDWGKLMKIAWKRHFAAINLLKRGKHFVFYMGTDPALNAKELVQSLERE